MSRLATADSRSARMGLRTDRPGWKPGIDAVLSGIT
jgi:hypothetical protein